MITTQPQRAWEVIAGGFRRHSKQFLDLVGVARQPKPSFGLAGTLVGITLLKAACFQGQVTSTAAKCMMLYASADHNATQRTFANPRTAKACRPRNAFKSAFTVSEVEARSL